MLTDSLEDRIRFSFQSVKRFCEITGIKMHLVRRALARQEVQADILQEIIDKAHAADPETANKLFLSLREEILEKGETTINTTQFIELFSVLLNHTKIIDSRDPRSMNWIDPVHVDSTSLEPDPRIMRE